MFGVGFLFLSESCLKIVEELSRYSLWFIFGRCLCHGPTDFLSPVFVGYQSVHHLLPSGHIPISYHQLAVVNERRRQGNISNGIEAAEILIEAKYRKSGLHGFDNGGTST